MKKIFLTVAVAGACVGGFADTVQEVTMEGVLVEKSVVELSFEGDNAIVAFADGERQTVDMGGLSITLSYPEQTAIKPVNSDVAPTTGKIFNMAGQYVGNDAKALGKGIYIINGKKTVVK